MDDVQSCVFGGECSKPNPVGAPLCFDFALIDGWGLEKMSRSKRDSKITMKRTNLSRLSLVVTTLCLATVLPRIQAANRTWSGAGTDNNWGTAANWGGTAPVNNDNLIFSGTTQQSNSNNLSNLTVGWLDFANGGFTLTGNAMTLNPTAPGVITNLAGVNTISQNLTITPASKYWSIAPGSEIRLTGTITNPAAAGTSIGWLLLTNGGTVRIMNNAQSQRGMDIWQGTVIVDGNAAVVNAISDGIRFRPPAGATASVIITNNGTLMVGGSGNFRMGNSQTSGGGTPAGAGSTSQVTMSSGTLQLYGPAVSIFLPDNIAGLSGVFNQNGGLVWGSAGIGNTLTFGNAASPTGIYNLNGGTLWIGQIKQLNGGANVFNFNGGTLKPATNSSSFFAGVDTANVQSGGAIIDTTNFNIAIQQSLSAGTPSGGLTKLGSGTLALTGFNTYTGNTVISNGTLALNPTSMAGGGAFVLAGGATLSLTNFGGGMPVSALIMNPSGTGTLQFNFPVGNPNVASIQGGSLNAQGQVVINISGSGFATGLWPLITFTNATGLANIHLGSIPPGIAASLVTSSTSIQLNITSVGKNLEWSGATGSNWDTTSLNWYDLGNGNNPTNYSQGPLYGDIVTFDDGLASNSVINLTVPVVPVSITVNSSANNYMFAGPGRISGVGTLIKNGSTQLTLGTSNDFSGGTALNQGTIYAGADQALGSGPVTMAGFTTLSSDSTTPRTLSSPIVQTADAGVVLGDTLNNGTLFLAGNFDLGGGATRTLNFNSDVVISGSLTDGGIAVKTGPGAMIMRGISSQSSLTSQQQGDVIIDGGQFTSLDGWRIQNTWPSTTIRLVVTNGGVFNVSSGTNTGNLRVGLAGGDSTANNILDIYGTVNMTPTTATVNGNNAVSLGLSGANDILYLRAGGRLLTRSLFGASPGNAEAHFMGGTLTAIANDSGLITGLTNAYMENGGLTIDTTNYSVTVPQPLLASGNGGLTKAGAGTLALTGASTYTGSTVVNAGKLVLGPAFASPGGIVVNANSILAFQQPSPPTTVNVPSVTIGGGANSALEAQLSVTNAAVAVITNLVLNGPVAVNVSGVSGTGQYPLFGFGNISGTGSLTLGAVPLGTIGHLVTNVPNQTIDLVVSGVAPIIWSAAANGNWDLATTNWTVLAVPIAYSQNANVLFNDTAAASAVSLTTSLTPGSIVVSNNSLNYTFAGSGSLSGTMTLVKDGTNSLALNTANSYSGATTIKAGSLVLGNTTALGAGTASATVQSGATLDVNGNTVGTGSVQPVVAGGAGVGGKGAIINSGADQNNALRSLTLMGNTTIGGTGVIGLRTTSNTDLGLVANGYKLTKVGSNQVNLNGGTTVAGITNTWFLDIGNIDIQQGILSFQRHAGLGNPTNTITVESGATLLLFSLNQANPVPTNSIVLNNATLQGTGGTAGDINTLGGQITLNGPTNIVDTTLSTTLVLDGPLVGPGGLVFSGANTLAGTNTYTGGTLISNGTVTLAAGGLLTGTGSVTTTTNGVLDVSAVSPWTLGANQTLGGSGTVNGSVIANGTVAPGNGTGTLTFNGNLTLAANVLIGINTLLASSNSMAVVTGSLSNTGTGSVIVSNLGPALVVGEKFILFNQPVANGTALAVNGGGVIWTNNLAVDGSISVLSVIPTGPTHPEPITVMSTSGNLSLSWPTIGWRLQIQTNSLSTGLNTNWVTWPNSTATNVVSFPVNGINPGVFFRLVYP